MSKLKYVEGQTIGRLTLLKYHSDGKQMLWKVRCECGNEQDYRVNYLYKMKCIGRKFECHKCKCERISPDLTGKIFGKLEVIKQVVDKDLRKRWLCRCKCGIEKEILPIHLIPKDKRNTKKSCGCINRKGHHMGNAI